MGRVATGAAISAFIWQVRSPGRQPQLAAGTNSVRPDETLELSRHAKALGYRSLMLAPPFYSLPSAQELIDHYRDVAEAVGLPIILYNFPARAGVDLTREVLDGLADVEAVCAIKESSGSFARMLEHVVYYEDRYQRICGADDQAVDAFLWGSKAWIAGASNFLPAEHMALYEACVVKQDFLLGKRLMHAMMPLFYLLEQGGKYLQYVKYGCELAGFPVGDVRRPLRGLSEAEQANFRRLYEEVKGAGLAKRAA
jgi:4-hydroxy-tetrahydrodipicolinate synthase